MLHFMATQLVHVNEKLSVNVIGTHSNKKVVSTRCNFF